MLVVAKGYRELLEKSQTVVTPDSDPEKPTVDELYSDESEHLTKLLS